MITMIMARTAGIKYVSAAVCVTVVAGVEVVTAWSTAKLVSADVGQYDSDPAKLAITVYLPEMSGTQFNENVPLSSLVVLPITLRLLLESITLMVTGTPVVFVGFPFCMYTYSIHALWLASDTAGTPFGKSAFCSACVVPAETSRTEPRITIPEPREHQLLVLLLALK